MNVKDTEDYYTSIIDQVIKEVSNIEQLNRSSEALDFLRHNWTEKLRNSGVFAQNQRLNESNNYMQLQSNYPYPSYPIHRQSQFLPGSYPMAYINPGSHPYSVHHHTPKTGYAFQNIHKPSIILKEESEFNNEYKVLGMGTIGEPTKRDRELEKQREIEKKKELEKQIEKEKIIEKEKEAANRNIINNNNGLNTINPLSGEKRSIFPLANEKKVEKIQIHIKKEAFLIESKEEEESDDDAKIFNESIIVKKDENLTSKPINGHMSSDGNEDEEEKKENGSQNHECSISRISDGAELNSDDDISEREEYETKNTLYCYYEKVSRTGEKWRVQLKDVIAVIEDKEYLFNQVSGELIFNNTRR